MKKADELVLMRLKKFALDFATDADWALVEKAVEEAGSISAVDGMAETLILKARESMRLAHDEVLEKAAKATRDGGAPLKRKKVTVFTDGRRNSRSLMPKGPNPEDYDPYKYELVNPDGSPYKMKKASFESRSEAARYAAQQRWKGHTPKGGGGKQVVTPEQAQVVQETMSQQAQTRYLNLRDSGASHEEAYRAATSSGANPSGKETPTKGVERHDMGGGAYVDIMRSPELQRDIDQKRTQEAARMKTIAEGDLSDIATVIRQDLRAQGVKVPFGAKPYLDALDGLSSMKDKYGEDSAQSIVAYLLSNLRGYKGETAKAVKAELKRRLKSGDPKPKAESMSDTKDDNDPRGVLAQIEEMRSKAERRGTYDNEMRRYLERQGMRERAKIRREKQGKGRDMHGRTTQQQIDDYTAQDR